MTIPKGASVSEVGDLLGEKGVIDSSTLFQIRVTLGRQALRALPGPLHPRRGHELRRRDRRALHSRRSSGRPTVTIPEGYSRAQAAQLVEEDGARRRLHEGDGPLQVPRPRRVRRQGRQGPRGLPLPRHLRNEAERAGRRPGPAAAAGLQAADQERRHELREVEEPDHLRRAHDRLDDRGRGGHPEPAQAGRLGDLQPAARRDAAGDRRDDPLRHRQLHRAADRIGAGDRLALQHAHQRRPAAGADQQPRPRRRSRPPRTRPRPTTSST